jgi:AbrB family looped-hinge helix DNA binding protein
LLTEVDVVFFTTPPIVKNSMPRVSRKRQITLPIEQCRALDIEPGDLVETFVYNGQITIVKKERGSAAGQLKHLRATNMSDEQSRQDAIKRRRG